MLAFHAPPAAVMRSVTAADGSAAIRARVQAVFAYTRILRVADRRARGGDEITTSRLAEAIHYRSRDAINR